MPLAGAPGMAPAVDVARTNSGLPSSPSTWKGRPPLGATPCATIAGSGYGRSAGRTLGFTPGWPLKNHSRPAGPSRRVPPDADPVPPDRQRPGVLNPAPAEVHGPWPDRTSMLAMVT